MKLFFLSLAGLMFFTINLTAQVSKTLTVDKAGTMISELTEEEANSITHLTINGKLNAVDFKHLRDEFKHLEVLDISNVDIKLYMGKEGTHPDKFYVYPANCIPAFAFCSVVLGDTVGKLSLKKVILSDKIKNIEDGAFKKCINLKVCQINQDKAPNLMNEALSDKITAVFIPVGSRDSYYQKNNWANFTFIEGKPVEAIMQVGRGETLYDVMLKTTTRPQEINFLTIEGKLDQNDYKVIRDYMPNLVELNISRTNSTEIPEFTFAQKRFLMRIWLPEKLKVIGQRAFSGCIRLNGTLRLPETVTSIEFGAFIGCDNLKRVLVTGNALTGVGNNLFGEEENKLIYK